MNILVKIKQHSLVIVAAAVLLAVVALLQILNDSPLVKEGVASAGSNGLWRSPTKPSSTFGAEGVSDGDTPGNVDDDLASRPSIDNVEASLTANNEIDLVWYGEKNGSGGLFEILVHELRNMTSLEALEQRAKYEELFLSPQQTQNGSVRLETLECGNNLCVVEFSGNDDALLNAYAKAVFTSDTFGAPAIYQPSSDAGEFPDIYRRYIFSHNSEIDTISSSDRKFVFAKGKVHAKDQ